MNPTLQIAKKVFKWHPLGRDFASEIWPYIFPKFWWWGMGRHTVSETLTRMTKPKHQKSAYKSWASDQNLDPFRLKRP